MFLFTQLKQLFILQCINYQEVPETGPRPEALDGPRRQPEKIDSPNLQTGLGEALGSARREGDTFTQRLEELARDQEISTLAEGITFTEAELGGENLEDINPERRREIFEARLANITENEIPHSGENGPVVIREREYVEGLASDYGINPEVLLSLRASGFRDGLNWDNNQISDNYQTILDELQAISNETGLDISNMTASDILSLYETMGDNDEGESSNVPLAPEAAAAQGIEVRRDPDGGFQISPNAPGYRQTPDGSVVGSSGAPYSRGGQIFRGTGEISTEVAAQLDSSYSGLQENVREPLSEALIGQLEGTTNYEAKKELIEQRIPEKWHGSAVKLATRVDNLNPSYPILLASMTERRGLVCYPDGKVDEFPIIIGSGGFREGAHSGGATTPTYEVFNFNMNTKITGKGNDASNGGSTTVLGASIQSPEAADSGGKWWHGVADSRIPNGGTLGCIGAKQENMMMAARAVLNAGGGYGFHTRTKNG